MQISRLTITLIVASIITAVAMSGCSGSRRGGAASDTAGQTAAVAAAPEVPATPPRVPEPGDSDYVFSGRTEVTEYVESGPKADRYQGGILPVIARETPEYAARLIPELARYDGFIVVDKAAMEVILYDREGHVKRQYGMACARNYGTKHKKADSRTPEGFFSVEGRYNSTEWLYTDDNVRPEVHQDKDSDDKPDRHPRHLRALVDRPPREPRLHPSHQREHPGTRGARHARYARHHPAGQARPRRQPRGGL